MSTEPSGNESRPSVDRLPARNIAEAVNSEARLRVHSLDANRVVRNGRNQYSLWPAEVAIPTGWSDQGVAGTREVCLAYIASAWVDMTSVPFADGAGIVRDVVPEPWVDARLSAARGARVPLPPASVHELIARTQQADPGAVALRCAGKVVTRGELRTRTAQWSDALAGLGAIPGQPIAMLVPRSIEAVVAILAILERGSPYLPLSCDDPEERLLRILNDAGNPIVLADAEQAARLAEYRGTVAQIRQLDEAPRSAAREPHPSRAGFDDLAYIMYTSGTTGAPKGVTGTHGQLVNYVRWCAGEFALRPGECTVLLAPLHFLGSVMTVFTPLVAGWPIEIAPATSDIAGLLELIGGSGCGFLKVTPSHVRAMSGLGPMARIARQVMITSETLYMTPELSAWMSASPESRFANQYGMSETCGSTWWWVPARVAVGERIPVGRPIFNAEAYIVGSDGELVPFGQPGELCVAGAVIGAGYQGQPSLTAERWLPNPWGAPGSRLLRTGDLARMDESGVVDIIGRADRQVKVRGHRVELPSIEEALRACPGLGDAVVLPATDRTPLELVAYLRPVAEPAPTVAELREHIARFLPEAAIPSRFVYLTSFPVTPNGKVDFARLPSCEGLPPPLASRHVAPGSATEATICRIFAEVLQVAKVGALDNFFELGGDSLRVIEAATAIEESLSVELSVGDLFDYPSSRALAAHLFAQTSRPEPS